MRPWLLTCPWTKWPAGRSPLRREHSRLTRNHGAAGKSRVSSQRTIQPIRQPADPQRAVGRLPFTGSLRRDPPGAYGVAQVQVPMDMHLIDVDQQNVSVTDAREQPQQLLNMGRPFLRLGLAQQLLDLLPGQLRLPQDAAEAVAPGDAAEGLQDPLLELLQRPVMAGQAVVGRLGVLDGRNDLFCLLLVKRGARPPLRR